MALRKRKGDIITKKDVAYVSFSLDEHIALLENKKSCPWDNTVCMHKTHAENIKKALAEMRKTKKVIIDENDYLFIQFSLNERADFLTEGIGTSWHKDAIYDAIKNTRFLAKLRRILGLSETADEEAECFFPEDG